MTPFEIIDLEIDSLSYHGGRGVGRYQGIVVFVEGGAPNETARVQITNKKKRYWEGHLISVVKPSAWRRSPPCPVARECGGCSWQHVIYAGQVEQKQKILVSSLRALIKYGEWDWLPFLESQEEFYYRNRIQLHIQNQKIGFFKKRSHQIVPTRHCWIAEPPLNHCLEQLNVESLGTTQKLQIALTESGEVATTLDLKNSALTLFSQVHRAQNKILQVQVVSRVEGIPDYIIDLYAGDGNLSFQLGERYPEIPIIGIELNSTAVERAQKRRASDRLWQWHCGDVNQVLKNLPHQPGKGLVVLDPPRGGCDRMLLEEIIRREPKQIIYVSCNPTTFARDAEILLASGRFSLSSVQGLDMFPQTEHVELISSLCAAT